MQIACVDNDGAILLAKRLADPMEYTVWPAGCRIAAFDEARHPRVCHSLLSTAYAQGQGEIGSFANWWAGVSQDDEYARDRMFVVEDEACDPVAFAHCWSSGFVKDIAVAERWRRRGLGTALMHHLCRAFGIDGFDTVRLKVTADNHAAIAFYHSLGMTTT